MITIFCRIVCWPPGKRETGHLPTISLVKKVYRKTLCIETPVAPTGEHVGCRCELDWIIETHLVVQAALYVDRACLSFLVKHVDIKSGDISE